MVEKLAFNLLQLKKKKKKGEKETKEKAQKKKGITVISQEEMTVFGQSFNFIFFSQHSIPTATESLFSKKVYRFQFPSSKKGCCCMVNVNECYCSLFLT